MSDPNLKDKKFSDSSEEEEFENYNSDDIPEDEESEEYWSEDDETDREQALEEMAIALVNELTAIHIALNDRQQLTDSFGKLNSTVVDQQQQIQTIVSLLEQLTQSLSSDRVTKLLQIQKNFGAFAQKLEMFEKGINSSIRQNQESREKADEIYQNLNRGWRQLAEDNKIYRRAIIEISSIKNIAILAIGIGLSTAGFILLAFKLFMTK
jgi:ABC-type transporter Mla subunit MlaD